MSFVTAGPSIECAGYFHFPRTTEFLYRLQRHHLIFVDYGEVIAQTADGSVTARPHDILCLRPNAQMSYRVKGGSAFYEAMVRFFPPPRSHLTPEFPETGALPILTSTGGAFSECRRLFDTICLELPQPGTTHSFRLQAAIYRILALIVATARPAPAVAAPAMDALAHIFFRVSSVYGGDYDPAALARELGVSRGYFLQTFKRRFGLAPGACRMRARLQEAIRRLRETDDAVKQIAYDLGFDGAKGLTRALKKHLKQSASELRSELGPEPALPLPPDGLFANNQNLLPPGDDIDQLRARLKVIKREL